MTEKIKPEHTIRLSNGVKATIWRNDSQNGTYLTAAIRRTYKDVDGNYSDTSTFRKNDLLFVAKAAQLAFDYIREHGDADPNDR